MMRVIDGFHQDEVGDRVADLRCGHGQHVRHRPPSWVREWVLTPEGRAGKVGVKLPCILCDRFELPAGHVPYKRTRDFDQLSIPDGLKKDHSTKPGVWGVIFVLAGRLRYIVEPPLACERLLEPGAPGIVVPEVLRRVVPEGEVRFFVEFHRHRTDPA